jgi:hypothetical protein
MKAMTCAGVAVVFLVAGLGSWAAAPAAGEDDPWGAFGFLMGEWEGEGDAGAGTGRFSLEKDLQGKVLVRKHRAEIPAAGGRPAAVHEDLMVIHHGEGGGAPEADYFDSEGHVIRYKVTVSDDKRTLTFVSDPKPSAPRFRLSYAKGEQRDTLRIAFEIAPPGKPDEFKAYLKGSARKRERAKPKSGQARQ